ncbi:MAG: T9SS type A sorting domain-containing protein [Cyclobacteriaceae bacterium]
MKKYLLSTHLVLLLILGYSSAISQHTVARRWNEVVLTGIRNDFARPTVHARNLFHTSAAMYDCWAVFDPVANPYFLGRDVHGYKIEFKGFPEPDNIEEALNEAISYACYRIIRHRFEFSPDYEATFELADALMTDLGYDTSLDSELYSTGSPAALGNYLAARIIEYGLQDGSNEIFDYDNLYYSPKNNEMVVDNPGSQNIIDPNRWQPLAFDTFIDQSGNEIPGHSPDFLSPEWANTNAFALQDEDATTFTRDGDDYKVYHDPGMPALLDPESHTNSEEYKWGFSLVSIWSSHLDPADNELWDISPGGIGNLDIDDFPTTIAGLRDFYNELDGGDPGTGYTTNPKTGMPYPPQMIPRGDYGRVLAEFWADGPDSETPPGHWFTIINYINDHPDLEKKFKGSGEVVDDLEWDVKSYFMLGGAMHDAAISAWGIKGYYDYIRPISAIRYLADQGQSSDPNAMSYSEAGIPLVDNYVELVEPQDPLAGENGEHVGKIKVYAWKGPDYIEDPETDIAGVGWILAENWWPYQRPSFVTPPFAGYVSGHSTYSRAAAELLTLLTGDEYFPGGVGEFEAPKNEILVFEDGPSVDVTLQWAKYYDASDQCSLSRIWGGIHPPVDDMPGRIIGKEVGIDAFEYAEQFFNGRIVLGVKDRMKQTIKAYPNPLRAKEKLTITGTFRGEPSYIELISIDGKTVENIRKYEYQSNTIALEIPTIESGMYVLKLNFKDQTQFTRLKID